MKILFSKQKNWITQHEEEKDQLSCKEQESKNEEEEKNPTNEETEVIEAQSSATKTSATKIHDDSSRYKEESDLERNKKEKIRMGIGQIYKPS